MAEYVSTASKDPSTKVGSVIVRPDRTVASVGFNGFPKGMLDDPDIYKNRELKYSRIIHAEMNALLFCKEKPTGYTLYTWPFPPCDRCAVHMVQAGIARVVSRGSLEDPKWSRWYKSWELAMEAFQEAGVKVDLL